MTNLNLLTNETRTMLTSQVGHRYEALYGEGYRDIKEVCIHEVFELGNTDIPATILTLYEDLLNDDEKDLLSRLDEEEECEGEEEIFGDICLNIARKVCGSDVSECVWLCSSVEDIKTSYLDMVNVDEISDDDFDTYNLPSHEKVCVLSDIGSDGALIAW